MSASDMTAASEQRRVRGKRLEFRVDARTMKLVERAAQLEQRSLTDYCLTALTEAASRSIARHDALVLSERDRHVFFDTLINPPKLSARVRRAFKAERRRIAR